MKPEVEMVFVILGLVGCAISEEEAQERWDGWVAENNACSEASDCVAVFPGCPLGCFTAVSASAAAAAGTESNAILDAYERGGRQCDYDCDEAPPLTCDAGACGFEE